MASDEFRVEVDLHERSTGHISERLRSLDLDDEVAERLGDRVIVTRDGERIYVYTQTAEAAKEAERVVGEVLDEDGVDAEIRRRRWNQSELFWQDADEPLAEPDVPVPGPGEARPPIATFRTRRSCSSRTTSPSSCATSASRRRPR